MVTVAIRDPYLLNTVSLGPYSGRTEIDLRQELENMFNGAYPEIAKAQKYLLRKFSRDSALVRIACTCIDALTHEPDKDVFCPVCHGEGYLWDEVQIQLYRQSIRREATGAVAEALVAAGLVNVELYSFWIKSSVLLTLQDKIVRVALDEEGDFAAPIRREELWRIGTLLDLRSDHGRLEFWQAICYAEKRTFLNGPTRDRINR